MQCTPGHLPLPIHSQEYPNIVVAGPVPGLHETGHSSISREKLAQLPWHWNIVKSE